MRIPTLTYVYDDTDPARPPRRRPGTPARVVQAIQSPPYTIEDQALLAALAAHEAGLCPGCREPQAIAWHSDMDGYYDEPHRFVCHACTARRGDGQKAIYVLARHTRDLHAKPLPPFRLGVTTTDS